MYQKFFRSVYETQERLRKLNPEHDLFALLYTHHDPAHDSYIITICPGFLERYPTSRLEEQLPAYIAELEKAIMACEKPSEITTP